MKASNGLAFELVVSDAGLFAKIDRLIRKL